MPCDNKKKRKKNPHRTAPFDYLNKKRVTHLRAVKSKCFPRCGARYDAAYGRFIPNRTAPNRTISNRIAPHRVKIKTKKIRPSPYQNQTPISAPQLSHDSQTFKPAPHHSSHRRILQNQKNCTAFVRCYTVKSLVFFRLRKSPRELKKIPSLAGAPSRQMHITGIKSIWARLTTRPDQGRRLQNVRITTSTIHTTAAVEL